MVEHKRKIDELQESLNMLNRQASLRNGEFESMRTGYERQLGEKNAEINMLKEKCK